MVMVVSVMVVVPERQYYSGSHGDCGNGDEGVVHSSGDGCDGGNDGGGERTCGLFDQFLETYLFLNIFLQVFNIDLTSDEVLDGKAAIDQLISVLRPEWPKDKIKHKVLSLRGLSILYLRYCIFCAI